MSEIMTICQNKSNETEKNQQLKSQKNEKGVGVTKAEAAVNSEDWIKRELVKEEFYSNQAIQ